MVVVHLGKMFGSCLGDLNSLVWFLNNISDKLPSIFCTLEPIYWIQVATNSVGFKENYQLVRLD